MVLCSALLTPATESMFQAENELYPHISRRAPFFPDPSRLIILQVRVKNAIIVFGDVDLPS